MTFELHYEVNRDEWTGEVMYTEQSAMKKRITINLLLHIWKTLCIENYDE